MHDRLEDNQLVEICELAGGVEHAEIGKSFTQSFEEMKSVYAAKLKYLVKFADKASVRLELEALKIN